jgi:hypothetical protein
VRVRRVDWNHSGDVKRKVRNEEKTSGFVLCRQVVCEDFETAFLARRPGALTKGTA